MSPDRTIAPNRALEPTAAAALRALAVPSSLRSSAAAQRERWAPICMALTLRTIAHNRSTLAVAPRLPSV
jgi:hypothetical protein